MTFRAAFTQRLVYYLNSAMLPRLLTAIFAILYVAQIAVLMLAPTAPFDFNIDYLAAAALAHGQSPYVYTFHPAALVRLAQDYHLTAFWGAYYYPPLTAQLIVPLTWLPPQLAGYIWLGITAACFLAAAWLLGKSTPEPYATSLALLMIVSFGPAYVTLGAGQINGLMLLALCFTFYSARRNNAAALGVNVALAAMLKIVPLAHLAYLGWRRAWKAFGFGILALVLLLALALPLTGWSGLVDFARLFVDRGLNLPTTPLSGLLFAGRGLVIAVTALACWPRGAHAAFFELEFSIVTLAANVVAPYAYYHQDVLMVIPLFVAAKNILAVKSWRWLLGLAVVTYALINGSTLWLGSADGTVTAWVSAGLWGGMAGWLIYRKFFHPLPRTA